MNGNAERSHDQAGPRTPAEIRNRAAHLRLQALLFETSARAAETGYTDLGEVGMSFAERCARHLRECAREASWTATQLDVWADELPCEVGRLDEERPPSFAVVPAQQRDDVA